MGYLVFTHDNRFTVTRDCDLVIARLGAEDGGGYECQVVDRRSGSITQVLVQLQVVPSKYQDHPLQRDDPSMIAGTVKAESPLIFYYTPIIFLGEYLLPHTNFLLL